MSSPPSPATHPSRRSGSERFRLAYITTEGSTLRYLARGQLAFLENAGFEVHLIADPDPDLARAAAREGVRASGVPMDRAISPLRDLLSLGQMARTLRHIQPDLVNASTPKAGLLGTLAARLAGVGTRVYTLRGLRLETAAGINRAILTRAERFIARSATRIVCVSESLKRRAVELGLVDPAKALVLGGGSSNGVDTDRYRPPLPDDPECRGLRRQLGVPDDAPIIGFVGRLSRDKGIEDVAEIFLEQLLPAYPNAWLMLLGRLDRAAPAEPALLRRLAAHPQVIRVGFEDDISVHYRLMHVLAFPSHREGFPNAPLEAAATALPVAGYAATGTVDAVQHGVTGTLVPTGARGELGQALLAYLANADLQRRHGRAGRRRAESEFSQELVWRAWAEIYRHLLGDRRTVAEAR